MMERGKLIRANVAIGIIDAILIVALLVVMITASQQPRKPKLYKHAYYPFTVEMVVLDTPLMHSRASIINAMETGVVAFDFDGEHYIIEGMPKEYIEYSVRCARLPRSVQLAKSK